MAKLLTGSKSGYLPVSDELSFQYSINPSDPSDKLCITGYKEKLIKKFYYYFLIVIFIGIPLILMKWYPRLFILLKSTETSLKDATYVLLKDATDKYFVVSVRHEALSRCDSDVLRSVIDLSMGIRFFHHKHIKYVFNPSSCIFEPLRGWDSGEKTVKELLDGCVGLTGEEQSVLLSYYGKNIICVGVNSLWDIFSDEIIHPFYIFQLFSIILWCVNEYVFYGIVVLILTTCSIFVTIRSKRRQQISLCNLVERSKVETVRVVRRNGEAEIIDSEYLVPGDVIEIPAQGCIMACDAVLLNGLCIVNESTLTGESAPATKTPPTPSNDKFDSFLYKRNTLYCGTQVLQTRYYGDHTVTALVVNTGFNTAKGELIRSLLHPKQSGFKFYEDSLRFLTALFILAALGIFYLVYIYTTRGVDVSTIVLDALDLITVVVPPALPAALTTGMVYAQRRLKQKNIFCTNPERINIAGKLTLFCFDKTGTLTEEGLDLCVAMSVDKRRKELRVRDIAFLDPRDHFAVAMAACHSLTRIDGTLSGDPLDLAIFNATNWELQEVGSDATRYDSLCPTVVKPRCADIYRKRVELIKTNRERTSSMSVVEGEFDRVLKSRRGSLDLPAHQLTAETVFDPLPYEVGIVRQFPFSSASQGMCVITRLLGADHMVIYAKGAPEKIIDLCLPDTIPSNVFHELKTLTSAGYRVIAYAHRSLDRKFTWRKSQRASRQDVEKDLYFLGLAVFKNNLRPNTKSVIRQLRNADIRCVMVTGDSLLTAVCVSRECGLVLPDDMVVQVVVRPPAEHAASATVIYEPMGVSSDSPLSTLTNRRWHYAIDGSNLALLAIHSPEMVSSIIVRGTVFARMLPEQKTQLIQYFQDLNYNVGMCGDGANDTGAMKAAHVGISLAGIENSVAAPFTSTKRDLDCVLYLLKEGRCALVTSFTIFKYMSMYSLIQFITVLILYTRGVSLSTLEFLYVDLVITSSLAVVIGRTGPTSVLHRTRPLAKLFCASNLVPLVLEILLVFGVQLSSLYFLGAQPWFSPLVPSSEDVTLCWENTAVYSVSCYQYLILAIVYYQGKPHCQPFFTDYWFMATFVFLTAFTTILTAQPWEPIAEWFELMPPESDSYSQSAFRVLLLLLPALNLLLSLLIENAVAQRQWLKSCMHFVRRKKLPKNRYKRVLLENQPWDPCSEANSSC